MTQRDRSIKQPQWRAETYWFLAALYGEPITGPALARLAGAAAKNQEEATGIGDEFRTALAEDAGCNFEELSQRLASEHARLFLGLRQGYGPPPPYESMWREARVLGDSTLAVATAYSEAGFEDAGQCGPCDHIASELRFLASLCHAEAEAAAKGETGEAAWARERQINFVDEHLLRWVPQYCQELARQSREPLYAALAHVTGKVVAGDALTLAATAKQASSAIRLREGVAA